MKVRIALFLMCLAGPLIAAPSLGILDLEISGQVTSENVKLARQVTKGMRIAGSEPESTYRIAPGTEQDFAELRVYAGCFDGSAECMRAVGESLSVDFLGLGKADMQGDTVVIEFQVFDVKKKKNVQSAKLTLKRTTLQADAVGFGKSFYWKVIGISRTGSIFVRANMPDASVFLNGKSAGKLKNGKRLIKDVAPGKVTVRIEKDGLVHEGVVLVKAGKKTSFQGKLEGKDSVDSNAMPPSNLMPSATRIDGPKKESRTASKALFWTSTALFVGSAAGLTFTGLKTLELQDDKTVAINQYKGTPGANPEIFRQQDNACAQAADMRNTSALIAEVDRICSDGEKNALRANLFLAGTIVTGAAAGYFLYKGYIEDDEPETGVVFQPTITPDVVGGQFTVEF